MWWKRQPVQPRNKGDTEPAGSQELVRATVTRIYEHGEHGPYFISVSDTLGSVTCSLRSPVWQDEVWPKVGQVVIFDELDLMSAGWRAIHGRRVRPSDEQVANSKKKTAISKKGE